MTTPEELLDLLKYDITTNSSGTTIYRFNGKIHRDEDQPAVIETNGTTGWYQDGHPHRDNDLPAVINANGDKWWYKDGKFIR